MSGFTRALFPTVFLAALAGVPLPSHGMDQTSGVNLTADEVFGARQQGMGLMRAGFQDGADAVVNAPASMNDVNDLTFSTSHLEQFEVAQFDNASLLVPWHADGTFGFALARYGVNDVESHGTAVPDSLLGKFGYADWLISGSFARRWGSFDLGGTVHLLARNLGDQSGMGLRGDAMGQYTFSGKYRAGLFIRGLVPSTARFQSGWLEYETPEASAFVSGRWNLPYFYGQLQAGYETPGLVQKGGRSANSLEGERAITDPLSLFKTSKAGAEFRFNFGLRIRAGLDELNPATITSSIRLGTGYDWRKILGVDYAFSAHPSLGQSHRVALWWTPSFPRFQGRGFRPHPVGGNPSVEKRQPDAESSDAPELEETDETQSGGSTPEVEKNGGKEVLEDE